MQKKQRDIGLCSRAHHGIYIRIYRLKNQQLLIFKHYTTTACGQILLRRFDDYLNPIFIIFVIFSPYFMIRISNSIHLYYIFSSLILDQVSYLSIYLHIFFSQEECCNPSRLSDDPNIYPK